jgi:hypothetical protein
MRIFVRALCALVSVVLALFLLGVVACTPDASASCFVALASLVALAVVRRRRVLWVPWVWSAAVGLGAVLSTIPYDVQFDPRFPPGVYVRQASWGLLVEPVPLDAEGVPEFWSGGCFVPFNAPEKVIVFGY